MKTIEQIKGELMYMLLANGYEQYGSSVRVFNPRNDRSYDLDTIDGIAAMMPEGWKWKQEALRATGQQGKPIGGCQ